MRPGEVAAVGAAGLVAVAVIVAKVVRAVRGGGASATSPRRKAAAEAIQLVVPSTYGTERFTRLAPGFTNAVLEKFPTFTTCGYLPAFLCGYIAKLEGGSAGKFGQAGLELLRTEGRRLGCWREPQDGPPRPYDIFALASEPGGGIVHVGVAVDASGQTWKTADAGQGPKTAQRAEFIERTFDAQKLTLTTNGVTRYLAGFLDLDAVPLGRQPNA